MLNLNNFVPAKVENLTLAQIEREVSKKTQLAVDSVFNQYYPSKGKGLCTWQISTKRTNLVQFMTEKGYTIETRVPRAGITLSSTRPTISTLTPVGAQAKFELYHELYEQMMRYAIFKLHVPVTGFYMAAGLEDPTGYIFTKPAQKDDPAPVLELGPHKSHTTNQKTENTEDDVELKNIKLKEETESRLRFLNAQQVISHLENDDDDDERNTQAPKQWQGPIDDGPEP